MQFFLGKCSIPAGPSWLPRLETLLQARVHLSPPTSPPLLPLTHTLDVKWLNYSTVALIQTQSCLTALSLGFPAVPHTA